MMKIVKIFSIIIITLTILCTLTNTFVYAQDALPNAGKYEPQSVETPQKFSNMMGTIATIIQTVGVVASVVVLIMLGIKYMVGSVEERADYKKAMIPFLVGTVLIAAIGSILKIVSKITSQTLG